MCAMRDQEPTANVCKSVDELSTPYGSCSTMTKISAAVRDNDRDNDISPAKTLSTTKRGFEYLSFMAKSFVSETLWHTLVKRDIKSVHVPQYLRQTQTDHKVLLTISSRRSSREFNYFALPKMRVEEFNGKVFFVIINYNQVIFAKETPQ